MSTMKVFIYRRITLLDGDDDLDKCLAWVKRRRLPSPTVVQEHSDRGRKLRRAIGAMKAGDLLVASRPYNLAVGSLLIEVLRRLLSAEIGVVFAIDGLAFKPKSQRSRAVADFCSALKEIDRLNRKESRKRGVLFNQWMGKRVGREPMSEAMRKEVEAHLRAGKKVVEIVKLMNGAIGRTSIFAIARAMKRSLG